MQNVEEEHLYSILKELQKRHHYKQRGRPSFCTELKRYALLLRYTSKQPCKLPSLLEKIQRGGVESINYSSKIDPGKSILSQEGVLMLDEMYLQKGTQLHECK